MIDKDPSGAKDIELTGGQITNGPMRNTIEILKKNQCRLLNGTHTKTSEECLWEAVLILAAKIEEMENKPNEDL